MSKSSKLADLIADLDSTAPKDYDPEDVLEPMNDSAGQSDTDDNGINQADESAAREHYVSVGKSKLRSDQPLLDDPRYAGKRTNRRDLFGEVVDDKKDESEDEDEEFSGDEDSNDNDEDANNDSFDDDEDLMANAHTYKDDFNPDAEPESDSEGEILESDNEAVTPNVPDHDEDDEEDDSESDEELKEQDDEELDNEVTDELRKIQEEEKQMISQLSQSAQADVEKGKHVRQQLTLWDNCLESRIRMQKAVDDANRLPQNDTYYDFLAKAEGVEKDLEVAKNELREVIDDLMDIRCELFTQHGSVDLTEKEVNSRKRHLDDDDEYLDKLWKDISAINDVFVPFRNSTLEKWSNKVQAASGARLNKKFKAFDQNIMSQIENAMADKDGLIKRTQLQRSDYKIIGKIAAATKPDTNTGASDAPEDEGKKPDRHLNNYDVEIFDDHDFYQQQLRELIESRMVDTDDPLAIGMRWAARKQTEQKKKKRDVNRKASKGRQLRFNVHEKLQNFMAPIPAGEWHESMIDELYSSLLGQKIGL